MIALPVLQKIYENFVNPYPGGLYCCPSLIMKSSLP